jgi:surface antigen
VLTIEPAPLAPTGDAITACETNPLQPITAVATPPAGATIVWYDALSGGNVVADPTLSAVGTITYYAESQLGTCVSATRTPIVLTIEPAPLAPTASNQQDCAQNPLQTLTATATAPAGATVVWYDAPTGGNIVADPSLSAVGSVTYYAESQLGTCVSATRTPVTLTIDPAPEAPTADNQTVCESSPLQTLTATATAPAGTTVVWYDAPSGGNVVANPTWSAVGSVTYYAESQIGSCISTTRTAVTLTIEPAPLPTINGPDAMCALTAENIYNTEAGMTNYTWIVSAGGTITSGGTTGDNTITVTWNTPGPQTISVNYESPNGCSASTPTVRNITVSPIPNTSPIYHN